MRGSAPAVFMPKGDVLTASYAMKYEIEGRRNMSQIQERIAKLLALADSPNEHEAQAALLKARELMAEYKLRPEEIQATGKAKVIVKTVGITCTAMTDSWVSDLSAIIAGRYCCKAYRNRRHNGKKMEIGFAGLEDDYEICRRIFLYAYDCIKSRCREIKSENRAKGISGSVIREMCNAYGQGFVDGLCSAFQKQQEEHQEWGLVMAVPQAVNDATSHHKRATALRRARTDGWRMAYARAGYKDGTEFDVDHRLAPAQGAGQTAMPKHCEFAAAVRLEPGVYQNVQRMLALESFSKMSAERRQELGIRTDSEEQLLWVSYPDGAEIVLLLCSGQNNYYLVPKVRRPGEDAFSELTEYITQIFLRWLSFDIQGVRYMLEIQVTG